MGVVHCVYVWVLTDYKYVITSLVAQNSTQKTKQFWKGEANFQFIYLYWEKKECCFKMHVLFFVSVSSWFWSRPCCLFGYSNLSSNSTKRQRSVVYSRSWKKYCFGALGFFSFFHEVVFRPMDFFVSTLLALFQAEPEMPNNVSKHRWIPINVFRVSLIGTN